MPKPLILIVCTGNACRSQMAEAFLRAGAGEAVEVASAGVAPAGAVHPLVLEVMAEKGFDLRGAQSEHVNDYREREVSIVITVGRRAERECPAYRGEVKRYHWPFKDPVMVVGTEEMMRTAFCRTRDELAKVFVAYGRGLADGRGTAAGGARSERGGGAT